jgi:hypothetical protein
MLLCKKSLAKMRLQDVPVPQYLQGNYPKKISIVWPKDTIRGVRILQLAEIL